MAYTDSRRAAYTAQKSDAKRRGIQFLMTFAQWWAIWEDSGHWLRRGYLKGQYVMSRYGDKGAYEVGNVHICLAEENRAERNRNYRQSGHGRNPYPFFKDIAVRNEKARQAMIIVASKRKRDERGCFLPQEG